MSTWQRLGVHNIRCVTLPYLSGARLVITAHAACCAPQKKRWAGYPASGIEILRVHVEIDAESRAIILADRVDSLRVAEAALVFSQRILVEEGQALLGLRELLLDEPVGIGTHHLLRQRLRLDVEQPMPRKPAPLLGHIVEQMMLRNDVEDRRARYFVRVIEAHAVKYAPAAVVSRRKKFAVAESAHYLDLILRHGAERIAGMIVTARRFLAVTVAAQVRAYHREFARQRRRDLKPRQMRERISVHQQQRRPAAALDGNDAGAAGLDLAALKAFEHI